MKYIAIFDIPDDYGIGCAIAKIAPKGKEVYDHWIADVVYSRPTIIPAEGNEDGSGQT